jgi:hypothetical protein
MFHTKHCRGNQNTHYVFSDLFFPLENHAVYEVIWKNIIDRGQATDDNMAHAHCMLDT